MSTNFEDIRTILNRIDGVNVPVQEDADDTRIEDALIKKFGKDKAKVIMDYAYSQMTDSSEEIMKSHGLTFKGDTEDDKRWFQKYPWLAQLDNKPWMGRLFDIAGQGPDYGTPVKMDDAVQEKRDNTDIDIRKLLVDISSMKDRIAELAMDDGTKTSALTALGKVEDDIAQEIKGSFPEDADIDAQMKVDILQFLNTKVAGIERQIEMKPAFTQEDMENKEFTLKLIDFVQKKLDDKQKGD